MIGVRFLDVILVVLTLPIALLLGAPALGCVVAVAVWIVQRAIALVVEARAMAQADPRDALKLNFVALMIRVWLMVIAIVICGVAVSRDDGAAAAATMLVAFTIYLAITILLRTLDRKSVHA